MNVARLRSDIDGGRTGDKTSGIDPAAAPLGTDDEAAGMPIARDVAEDVRRKETDSAAARRGRANAGASDMISRATDPNTQPTAAFGARWFAAGLITTLAVLGVAVWWVGM